MLDKRKTGLIVVDIQGKLASLVRNSEALIASTVKLIKGARALNLPIICLEQLPDKLGPTVSEIADALHPVKAIGKHTFSGAGCPEFINAIDSANVDTWLVCGIEAHICVYQTVSDLLKMNVKVQLLADCVSSRTLYNKDLAIASMQAKGATITSLEMCLYELVGDSLAPEFKAILQLIK